MLRHWSRGLEVISVTLPHLDRIVVSLLVVGHGGKFSV